MSGKTCTNAAALSGWKPEADLPFRAGRYRNVLLRGPMAMFPVPVTWRFSVVTLPSRPSPFDLVLQRFPEWVTLIRRQLVARADFRSLCEDYVMLREMIAELEADSPAHQRPGTQSARLEYDRLRDELELEIARELAGFSGSAPP
jgi:hypothetical protein